MLLCHVQKFVENLWAGMNSSKTKFPSNVYCNGNIVNEMCPRVIITIFYSMIFETLFFIFLLILPPFFLPVPSRSHLKASQSEVWLAIRRHPLGPMQPAFVVQWDCMDRGQHSLHSGQQVKMSCEDGIARGGLLRIKHINGLVQERLNSIANALEICLSCTNPSI